MKGKQVEFGEFPPASLKVSMNQGGLQKPAGWLGYERKRYTGAGQHRGSRLSKWWPDMEQWTGKAGWREHGSNVLSVFLVPILSVSGDTCHRIEGSGRFLKYKHCWHLVLPRKSPRDSEND